MFERFLTSPEKPQPQKPQQPETAPKPSNSELIRIQLREKNAELGKKIDSLQTREQLMREKGFIKIANLMREERLKTVAERDQLLRKTQAIPVPEERSFIGGTETYEGFKAKSRELSQKTARIEEEERQARRLGDTARASQLKILRAAVVKEHEQLLRRAAEAKKYRLDHPEQ